MDTLAISISWEWALGIIISLCGSLIAVAWYTSGRFTKIETSMDWIKDTLKEIKTSSDNAANPAFAAHSPVNLTEVGKNWIQDSGLKSYIETHKDLLLQHCDSKRSSNSYEVQQEVFRLFNDWVFDSETENRLKEFAYTKGTTMAVMRRIGGIYLRDICLDSFGMNKEDIDKHAPKQTSGE